jgi:hypothetical protein
MGFGANGIVAGSAAAAMMSAEAIAAGGSIAAGGTVATLQSIGAVGLGAAAAPIGFAAGMVGGLVAAGMAYGVWSLTGSRQRRMPPTVFPRRCLVLSPSLLFGAHADEKIIEFERRIPFKGFKASHLFLNEPNFRYGDGNGIVIESKEDLRLPDGWKWADEWHVLKGYQANQSGTDPDGWMYAFNWGIAYAGSFSMTHWHCVRRRIWSRHRTCAAKFTQEEVAVEVV